MLKYMFLSDRANIGNARAAGESGRCRSTRKGSRADLDHVFLSCRNANPAGTYEHRILSVPDYHLHLLHLRRMAFRHVLQEIVSSANEIFLNVIVTNALHC